MATPTAKKVYVVDAGRFSTLVEAAAEFTRVFGFTMPWNGNLVQQETLRLCRRTPEV
jgi:hypothetical protein